MRSLFSRAIALGVVAMAVAGCAVSNGTALPPTSTANSVGGAQGSINGISNGTAAVQFVHGSPDAGSVDLCVDGQFAVIGATFKTFTTFYIYAAGVPHEISVYSHTAVDPNNVLLPAQTTDLLNGSCSNNQFGVLVLANGHQAVGSFTPTANVRNTLVIAGTNAKNTVQFVLATAAATIPSALAPAALFINASPANPKLAAGWFNATTGAGEVASATTFALPAVAATATAAAQPTFGALTIPTYAGTGGVAYYVAKTSSTTTPLASVYAGTPPAAAVPSAAQATAADTSNTGNLLPFVPKNDYLLTAVAVDQVSGVPLVIGHYDSITLGF